MRGFLTSFKVMDFVFIVLVLAIATVSGILIYGNRSGKEQLVIEAPGGTWLYALDTDRTIEIPGALGNSIIRIEGGAARFLNSACPNKTCVAAPALSHTGEWNACLPNQVIIRVDGEETDAEVDIVVQ